MNEAGPVQVELKEWDSKDVSLCADQAAKLLGRESMPLDVFSLGQGRYRLKAKSIVGRFTVGPLDLCVYPKWPMESLLRMLSEVYELTRLIKDFVNFGTTRDVFELLVEIFHTQVESILRSGLLRTYVELREELTAVRGRLDVAGTALLLSRGRPNAVCDFEQYTNNGSENRLLVTALDAVAQHPIVSPVNRSRVRRVRTCFDGVEPAVFPDAFSLPFVPDRLNGRYFPALPLAELILRKLTLTHNVGGATAYGFMIDMNQLFERFVLVRLKNILTEKGFSVSGQVTTKFDLAGHAEIRPDILIQGNGQTIVADTKYKITENAKSADLYQMLAYCRILKLPLGFLITAGSGIGNVYQVEDGLTKIRVLPLDLSGSMQHVDAALEKLSKEITDQQ